MGRNPESVKAARRRWYHRNAEHAKGKVKERRRALFKWFREYKTTLSCKRCDENHPATLDFHHRNPADKVNEIAQTVADGWSKEHILKEIAKCDVLCSNCHRKEHWSE